METILAPRLRTQRRCRRAGLTYKMTKNVKERNRKVVGQSLVNRVMAYQSI